MDITTKTIPEESVETGALILPFFEDAKEDPYAAVDARSGNLITKVFTTKEFTGKQNQLTLLHVQNLGTERLLLVGLGKRSEVTPERIRQAGGKALSFLRGQGVVQCAVSTKLFESIEPSTGQQRPVFSFMEGGLLGLYRFERYKKPEDEKELQSVVILSDTHDIPIARLQVVAAAVNFTKDLVNTPSNDMTPSALSKAAESLASGKVSVRVLEKEEAEREGMGAYLSVAKGSCEPPKFIILDYKGAEGVPLVLIGKAVTFDSGGLSIKPAEGMEKMKYDMAGGAAVLGVIKALAALDVPLHVIGVVPAAENLPGGNASRPGDIVRTISGKTVEIISTDAEGRMLLADALGYAIKYLGPKAMIDIATLTGACSIAFGNEAIAMMGTSDELMAQLRKASAETYERVWQMPLYEEYRDYIKSDFSDLKNAGGRSGSLVTAGYFLKEFAQDVPWVHLDIASTAWNEKDKPYAPKGSSGVGVRLLLEFLMDYK